MKTRFDSMTHIDKNGFGFKPIPTIFFGWENYPYLKVIQIDFSWLFFEILWEFSWR